MMPGSSVAKRCDKQPATMIFWRSRSGSSLRALTAPKTASIDSCLAMSMNEQVLTIRTSANSGSGVSAMPASARWPIMTSESIRFLAQPREMRPTVVDMDEMKKWEDAGWMPRDQGGGRISSSPGLGSMRPTPGSWSATPPSGVTSLTVNWPRMPVLRRSASTVPF